MSFAMQPSIRTNIAVVGRFHAFDLARELEKQGLLNRLMSTYPRSVTRRWGIPESKISGEPILEVLRRFGHKVPLVRPSRIDEIIHRSHARNAARRLIGDADVFIGWTGSSLEALIAAREAAATTILERGSSHCSEWRALLGEEHLDFGQPFDPMYNFWQRELLEYELADYIAIPSTFVRDTFIARGVPKEKLLVNAYGVDLGAFRQEEKADDVFRVISVGGFTIRKGSRYLLQAFSELHLPNAEFWHVGSVSPELQPHIEKYAAPNIVFHGHKPQAELYKYYSQASVFVLMSIEEGMAMVQSQAMACGLPLICTTNTGGADLIGDDERAGYVVPIRDVETLKARLLHLYENQDLCRHMGQVAKTRVSSGLTWADYGKRYAHNIRTVYERKRP